MPTPEAPKTQVKDKIPMSLETRSATGSKQWFLEDKANAMTPVFHYNTVQYFVCGEESFKQITADIKKATTNIDIVCWGFDPSMELIRDKATHWPRGESWASLLYGAATGKWNGGKRVKVRILCWYYMAWEELGTHNMPGYRDNLTTDMLKLFTNAKVNTEELLQLFTPGSGDKLYEDERSLRRQAANIAFYKLLTDNVKQEKEQISIELVVRDNLAADINLALENAPKDMTITETKAINTAGTHHQKTILIDYENTEKLPVGYVMGLNSVTNYWDTEEHLFNHPKRARQFENSPPTSPVPPLRDYASRLQGECLVMVSKNFSDAWRKYAPRPIERDNDPKKPPPHLTKGLPYPRSSAQIVRTDPLVQEHTVERLYYQIATSARNYLYIENQYFQYAPLLQDIKKARIDYVKGQRAAKVPKNKVPLLHLMVITCVAEKDGMIPRMHDAIKELGYGDSMPEQTKSMDGTLKKNKNLAENPYNPLNHISYKASDLLQTFLAASYKASGGGTPDAAIQAQLSDPSGQYAIRPVLACLASFNTDYTETESSPQREYIEALKTYNIRRDIYNEQFDRWLVLGRNGPAPKHPEKPQEPKEPTEAQLKERKKQRYQEVYIHSKLAIADDSIVTLGSTNMNIRSYFTDSEINVACDDPKLAAALRHKVWEQISGIGPIQFWGGEGRGAKAPETTGTISGEVLEDTVENWLKLIDKNGKLKNDGKAIIGKLVPLYDERTKYFRLG